MERAAHGCSPLHRVDARAKLLLTVVYLVTMLSMPLEAFSGLLLYAVYPILAAQAAGLRYGDLLRRSLVVLPFVALVGLFNILYYRETVFTVGPVAVTRGWIDFLSILLRGLLSVQALLLLILTTGYYRLCRNMQRMGLPSVFASQLLFVYRYLYVLTEEALEMSMARDARSYGRRSYPLRTWATLVGQLLIRTFARAERIGRAMLARGFDGRIPAVGDDGQRWRKTDTAVFVLLSAAFIAVRVLHPAALLSARLLNR